MLGSNSGVGVALSRGSGSLKVWSMLMRRPSFPQSSRYHHNNGRPAPTAASMAEMQDEDDEDTPTSSSSPPVVSGAPHHHYHHHHHHPDLHHLYHHHHNPRCQLFALDNTLHITTDIAPASTIATATTITATSTSSTTSTLNLNTDSVDGASDLLPSSSAATRRLENIPPPAAACTCHLSDVILGGVTSPDGSRTPLSTALTNNTNTNITANNVANTNNNKKPRRPRGAKRTVIFNVGGQTFETYRTTLKKLKNSFFADDDKMRAYFRPAQGDYFFDRDPTAFGCVLNYLRTGELHVPTTMCGPALQNELDFWGIEELDIERCCWTQYNTWKTQSRSLEKLEYDRKFSTTQNLDSLRQRRSSCWGRTQATVWQFLQDPASSRAAKAYAWVSIIFVFISIFSFCADTHPVFRVRAEDVRQFASVYRFFNLESLDFKKKEDRWNDTSTASTTTATTTTTTTTTVITDVVHNHNNEAGGHHRKGMYNQSGEGGNGSAAGEKYLPHPSLLIMDLCCLIFFTLEYVTRFVCSPSKLNFFRSFQNVIDFVAISPDYVELIFLIFDPMRREGMAVMDLMFILRMLRLCRIFRLIRHVPGLWILLYTLKASFNELMLMFVFLLIGMVVFATLMHFAEGQNGFPNIPVGFWWSVVTMTTVGYGDMFPQSAAGYVIGSCCAVAGLLMIAFTVPIIVSNFVLYYTHVQYGLARRDRELERIEEEGQTQGQGQGQGDEENQNQNGNGGGGGGDKSEKQQTSSGLCSRKAALAKEPVDSVAIALGENVALTSSVARQEDSVHFVNERSSSAGEEIILV
ncbi:potassium voltage-gated channel protein egl-36-like [Babylonia areolata]|uniref:potassium voltage-gated channel protein egl-36-like n=1 Tax=Babylonia areolata TaxID=304850 RepID=UPI003FD57F71